ncbi:MAG: hypothetical protein ACYSOZ_04850 [Planctomycetota bacterium]|jgi:hypothetical protein
MKWALLAVACVSLLMCYLVGAMAAEVRAGSGTVDYLTAMNTAAASTYSAGAIGAGLIGTASALGAAVIQVSENKKKD